MCDVGEKQGMKYYYRQKEKANIGDKSVWNIPTDHQISVFGFAYFKYTYMVEREKTAFL